MTCYMVLLTSYDMKGGARQTEGRGGGGRNRYVYNLYSPFIHPLHLCTSVIHVYTPYIHLTHLIYTSTAMLADLCDQVEQVRSVLVVRQQRETRDIGCQVENT